ncbi:hypothetical protein ACHAO1_010850 [Botrytis cinerea]
MIYSSLLSKVVAAAYVFQISIAHPGQTMQDLHCADILQKRGSEDRNSERIAATVAKVRADLGLPKNVSGEHIRSNLRETQAGVPLVIDGQFLDSTACEPIQDLYWDIWNCNSTGIYGGIPASPINDNVGVNHSVTYTASAAARLTANGGAPIAGGGRPPTAQSDKNVSH